MTTDAKQLRLKPDYVALEWYTGRTVPFSVTIKQGGVAVNITGATASMVLKDGGGNTALTLSTGGNGIVISDAANGIFTVSPEAVGTGSLSSDKTYKTDFKLTLSSGAVYPAFYGTVTLTDKITP